MHRILALLLMSLPLASIAAQAEAPRPYQVQYEAFGYGHAVGKAERRLERTGDTWRLTLSSDVSLLFFSDKREEVSELRFVDDGWQSLNYRFRDEGPTKTREGNARFDWEVGQANGEKNGKKWQAALKAPMFDPASYQLQLSLDVAAGKPALDYALVQSSRIKNYHFESTGRETLSTPQGKFETIRLEKRVPGDDEATIIWLAPLLDYVPVRIQHLSKGKPEVELKLKSFKPL